MDFDELARRLKLEGDTRSDQYECLLELAEAEGFNLGETAEEDLKVVTKFLASRGIEADTKLLEQIRRLTEEPEEPQTG